MMCSHFPLNTPFLKCFPLNPHCVWTTKIRGGTEGMAHLPLPHNAISRSTIIVLLLAAQILLPVGVCAQSDSFVPIPPTTKPLYRFNFEKLFYPNDAAWQKDINEFRLLKNRFEELLP